MKKTITFDDAEWVLVPIERNYDQRSASIIAFNTTAVIKGKDRDDSLQAAWEAQLAAAPEHPEAGAGVRSAIFEEAAKICDGYNEGWYVYRKGAEECARAIRYAALAAPQQANTFAVPFDSTKKCNPFVTQCPRCNNPWNECDTPHLYHSEPDHGEDGPSREPFLEAAAAAGIQQAKVAGDLAGVVIAHNKRLLAVLKDTEYFLTQVDPVHWPSRAEAGAMIANIRRNIAEAEGGL